MSEQVPAQFDGVSIVCKANVYFDGKVVSHAFSFPDGTKKSTGVIFPGTYTFNTDVAERMDVIVGTCRVQVAGASEATDYGVGSFFEVPAKSSFEIVVASGTTEYVCSYL